MPWLANSTIWQASAGATCGSGHAAGKLTAAVAALMSQLSPLERVITP